MKPKRNDPCPCGSNKKYKKCCGLSAGQKPIKASVISSGLTSKMSSVFQKGFVNAQENSYSGVSIKDRISTSITK